MLLLLFLRGWHYFYIKSTQSTHIKTIFSLFYSILFIILSFFILFFFLYFILFLIFIYVFINLYWVWMGFIWRASRKIPNLPILNLKIFIILYYSLLSIPCYLSNLYYLSIFLLLYMIYKDFNWRASREIPYSSFKPEKSLLLSIEYLKLSIIYFIIYLAFFIFYSCIIMFGI